MRFAKVIQYNIISTYIINIPNYLTFLVIHNSITNSHSNYAKTVVFSFDLLNLFAALNYTIKVVHLLVQVYHFVIIQQHFILFLLPLDFYYSTELLLIELALEMIDQLLPQYFDL